MDIIKKRIVWIVIIITIIYTVIIKYLEGNELHSNEIIGYSLGLLIIPFFISLIRGLYAFVRKKFSWILIKNTFALTWLIVMVISILFSPNQGLINRKDDVTQLKELVRQYASELNSQRKDYHYKIAAIGATDIEHAEDIKNIDLLINIKQNINKQKEVEDFNYQTSLILYGKWLEKFENFQKEHDNIETKKMIKELKENTINSLQHINEMKQIQLDYYVKYNQDIDFIIAENNNITIKNNKLVFRDEAILDRYNQLQAEFLKAAKFYIGYVSKWKEEKANKLNDLNKEYFNIQEIDTLINMVKYDKY